MVTHTGVPIRANSVRLVLQIVRTALVISLIQMGGVTTIEVTYLTWKFPARLREGRETGTIAHVLFNLSYDLRGNHNGPEN
jgi:hypothetical protein